MRERKRVGVFGTPCGGTNYLAHYLRVSGLEVGHERLERDGIVCGFWGMDERAYTDRHRPRPEDYDWEVLAVVARHPLLVAETLPQYIQRRKGAWTWSCEDPVLHALRYWVEAHASARAKLEVHGGPTATVRIDGHLDVDVAALCGLLGVGVVRPPVLSKSKPTRWPRLTWEAWRERDPSYAERGRTIVAGCGLDEPEP